MGEARVPGDGDGARQRVASSTIGLIPVGHLGFRGRKATAEERARVFEGFFFEGERRVPFLVQYFVLMALSATIAAFGLIGDSAAVVIGAMLVAPLMTPILAIAAASVQGWGRRAAESLVIVILGALAAVGISVVISLIVPSFRLDLLLPDELIARTSPSLIDLGIAVAAGAAGGFVAVRTEASSALPGVGIAVALVPPLATLGLTAGLGDWDLALGAFLLFVTNLVAIVLAAGIVLMLAGFGAYRDIAGDRDARLAASAVVVAVIAVTVLLAWQSIERVERSFAIAGVVDRVQDWSPRLQLQGVDIDHGSAPFRSPFR